MLNPSRNSDRNKTSTYYKAIIQFWRHYIAKQGKSNIDNNTCEPSKVRLFLPTKLRRLFFYLHPSPNVHQLYMHIYVHVYVNTCTHTYTTHIHVHIPGNSDNRFSFSASFRNFLRFPISGGSCVTLLPQRYSSSRKETCKINQLIIVQHRLDITTNLFDVGWQHSNLQKEDIQIIRNYMYYFVNNNLSKLHVMFMYMYMYMNILCTCTCKDINCVVYVHVYMHEHIHE